MKVTYTNKNVYKVLISTSSTIDEALHIIDEFIKKQNANFKSPYQRLNFSEKEIEVDVGSWSDFFYITEFTKEDIDEFWKRTSKIEKHIFITNGMARCGKDTFAAFLNEFVPTLKYSSIDKVKEIAKLCGWTGGKTERDRKFLSDLKVLTSEYSDLPFKAIAQEIEKFREDNINSIMLIDIREPKEIEKAKKAFGAKTILIENNRVKMIDSNMADANVFNYTYDYTIQNNGTLDEFREKVAKFAKEVLLDKVKN